MSIVAHTTHTMKKIVGELCCNGQGSVRINVSQDTRQDRTRQGLSRTGFVASPGNARGISQGTEQACSADRQLSEQGKVAS
jgi:hypothetical protein